MALTPLRWIAIAISGMLVFCILSVDRLPNLFRARRYAPTAEELRADSMYSTTALHNRRATIFTRQFRMAQLADSLRATSARSAGAQPPVRVSFGPGVNPIVRLAVDSAVSRGSLKIGATPRVGVDFVTLLDTGRVYAYSPWSWGATPFYILPARATDRCIVVLPIGQDMQPQVLAKTLATEDAARQIFGPCAYYAAFGQPGARVREWLRGRGGLFALGGSWTQNLAVNDTADADPYFVRRVYYTDPPTSFFFYSDRAVSCVVGDMRDCEASVLDVNPDQNPLAVGSAMRINYGLGPISRRNGAEFDGRETELFADMVRSLGRERFERFWTSSDPVPAAFQAATGMRLGQWISAWGAERVGPIKHGPTFGPTSLIGGLLIAGLCLMWAMFSAKRREFA